MKITPKIPEICEEELLPLVTALVEIIQIQQEQIQELSDEIARLKGQKPKPKTKPSVLEKYFENKETKKEFTRRPGYTKREKTDKLKIHETVIVKADNVPPESMFKGYEEFTVQGLIFQPHNTLYHRERWQTPDGASIVAPLPEAIKVVGRSTLILRCSALTKKPVLHLALFPTQSCSKTPNLVFKFIYSALLVHT